jgi:UPF0716 family protein affecting phage T7 exclusion
MLKLALITYLLIEALLTLAVGSWLGPGPTLLLLALGAAAGISVLRTEQFSLLSGLHHSLAAGEPLVPGLLNASLRGAAGLLMIIPGLLVTWRRLGLLIPPLRRRIVNRLCGWLGNEPGASVVIEGDYRRVNEPTPSSRGPGSGDLAPARTDSVQSDLCRDSSRPER